MKMKEKFKMNVEQTKKKVRTPLQCCDRVLKTAQAPLLRTLLLSAILVCLGIALILVLCGAFYARNYTVYFHLSLTVFFIAVFLIGIYIYVDSREDIFSLSHYKVQNREVEISTVCGTDYFSNPWPPDKVTEHTGPNMVGACTGPKRGKTRTGSLGSLETSSASNTPASLRRNYLMRKNLPPLASEETLSPSLAYSSYSSIDSVV